MEFKTSFGQLRIYSAQIEREKLVFPMVLDVLPRNKIKDKKVKKAIDEGHNLEVTLKFIQGLRITFRSALSGVSEIDYPLNKVEVSKKIELTYGETVVMSIEFNRFEVLPNIMFITEDINRPSKFMPVYPLDKANLLNMIEISLSFPESSGLIFSAEKEVEVPYKFGKTESMLFIEKIRSSLDLWGIDFSNGKIRFSEEISKSVFEFTFMNPIRVKKIESAKIIPVNLTVENSESENTRIKLNVLLGYRLAFYGSIINEVIRPPEHFNVVVSGLKILKKIDYDMILEGYDKKVELKAKDSLQAPMIVPFGKYETKLYIPLLADRYLISFMRAVNIQRKDLGVLGYPCIKLLLETSKERKFIEAPIIFETV